MATLVSALQWPISQSGLLYIIDTTVPTYQFQKAEPWHFFYQLMKKAQDKLLHIYFNLLSIKCCESIPWVERPVSPEGSSYFNLDIMYYVFFKISDFYCQFNEIQPIKIISSRKPAWCRGHSCLLVLSQSHDFHLIPSQQWHQ